MRTHKSDVFAVEFCCWSCCLDLPQCLTHGCHWFPHAGDSELPFTTQSTWGSIMHSHVSLKIGTIWTTTWMSIFPAQLLPWFASLCLWFRGGVCERWWDLAQFLRISSAADRTFCTTLETSDTYSEELLNLCPSPPARSKWSAAIPLKEQTHWLAYG